MCFDRCCHQVSAFSTWEKELHKIVFDPRYLLLLTKERKQVFEDYVKERAEVERKEKRVKIKDKKDQFRRLLDEAKLHGRSESFYVVILSNILVLLISIVSVDGCNSICDGFLYSLRL